MPSDLHTHTTFSDGKLTPEELISAARQAGLSYLAITDHDTVDGVAHLSLLPYFWNQIIEVNNLKMMVNYGMDKMRFGQAVLSGQKIRMAAELHSLVNLRGTAKAEIKFAIEIEGQKKKALEGIATFLYYFN